MPHFIFIVISFFAWSFLFLRLARKWPKREKLLRTVAGLPLVPFVVPFFMGLFAFRDNPPAFTMNAIAILLWTLYFVKMVRGKEHPVGCLTVLSVLFGIGVSIPGVFFQRPVVEAQYAAEPIPLVGHIRTQVDLYKYEHGRLPFDDAEAGTMTTWRNTDDGNYEPIQFNLKANANREPVAATNNILSRLEMPLYDMMGKRISPDQIQLACLVPGGVSEDGATTNAYAYAVGVFGSGDKGLPCGTGYAVLDAFFPDVVTTNEAGVAKTGYRFVATWKDYHKGETPIRFGYAGESGASDEAVCPLIPPEAFAPGAVTELHGDGPDSVEYWLERLSAAPCGRWEYSLP